MGSFSGKVKWDRNGKMEGLAAGTVLLHLGVGCLLSCEQENSHRRDWAGEK